ncbi:hypothetical protein PPACK8108_LOCUS13621, partial [Phakopsora pachyrhizi]
SDSFNEDQWGVIEKAMCTEEYALILGMPGTGKTTTIAELIKTLIGAGNTVLFTSCTHSAADSTSLK